MKKLPKVDVYKRADIIKMIDGLSPVEEDMMSDIIAQFDSDMGVGLAQNKIISIPY